MTWRYGSAGIATIELVIIAAFLVLATGLVVPVVNARIAANERAQALSDLRRMAADMLNYRRDTGQWPRHDSFAFTDGDPASGERACVGADKDAVHISRLLVINKPPAPNWNGPYMSVSRPGPWGHRYVIILGGSQETERPHGWVLSAGCDGVLDTRRTDRELAGDDLGFALR